MALSDAFKEAGPPLTMPLSIVVGDTVQIGPQAITVAGLVQDFSACTCTAKIRDSDGGSVIAIFTCTIPTPASGIVKLYLAPASTASFVPATDGAQIGVWDSQITDGTDTVTWIRGPVYAYFSRTP